MNSIKSFLENQIKLTLDEYKTRPERMISDYNREVELMNDYNGRQLYELLQNCDDAKAKSVLIELDEDVSTTSFCSTIFLSCPSNRCKRSEITPTID